MRKALLGVVLDIVAVGVWNFSTRFEIPSKPVTFSEFVRDAEVDKTSVCRLQLMD